MLLPILFSTAAEDEEYYYGGDNSEFECEIMDFDEDENTEEGKDKTEAPKGVKVWISNFVNIIMISVILES